MWFKNLTLVWLAWKNYKEKEREEVIFEEMLFITFPNEQKAPR